MILYESEIEQITLELLRDENGYTLAYGPDIQEKYAPELGFGDPILQNRLRAAIDRLNSRMPESAREEACKKVLRTSG